MTLPTEASGSLREYLLGRLDEARAAELEERYFGETESFDLLASALDDLTDEYVGDRLTPDERERFERLHAHGAEGQARVAFARALLRGVLPPAPPARPSFLRPLLILVRQQAAPFQLALAAGVAALLLAPAVAVTRVNQLGEAVGRLEADVEAQRNAAQSATIEASREREQRRHLENSLAAVTTTSFSLIPGSTRAGGTRLVLPAGTGFARFELAVEAVPAPPILVTIRRVGGVIAWSQEIRDSIGAAGPIVTVPTAALVPGDYEVLLSTVTGSGRVVEVGNYAFRIERR